MSPHPLINWNLAYKALPARNFGLFKCWSPSLYTIKENPLTYSLMFSEQTAPIGTYNIPMDSEFHADGCMEPKNGPRALTGFFSSWSINHPSFKRAAAMEL